MEGSEEAEVVARLHRRLRFGRSVGIAMVILGAVLALAGCGGGPDECGYYSFDCPPSAHPTPAVEVEPSYTG